MLPVPSCCTFLPLLILFVNVSCIQALAGEERGECAARPYSKGGKPKYWLANVHKDHLAHVEDAFNRLGYQLADSAEDDWSILWSFHSPFHQRDGEPDVPGLVTGLKPNQQVNQLPGAARFANKVELAAASHALPFLPKSFVIPEELEEFRNAFSTSPGAEWLVKGGKHRGVQFVASQAEAEQAIKKDPKSFVQQLIRPYLIDGRLWDVGVYVAVTSVDPLRVYMFDNLLLRHCSANYTRDLSSARRESYVVAENYAPPWAMESLRPYYKRGLSTANVLRAFLGDQGVLLDPVLEQMKEMIVRLLRHFQPHLVSSARYYPAGPPGFFTLLRFDFMLDPNLQPWLIEVNQSPNLSSEATPDLKNMFQRIAFSLLQLNGYAYGQMRHPFNPPGQLDVAVHHNDIDIGWRLCGRCEDSCEGECLICRRCRTPEQTRMLQELISEHRNRQNFMRLYPSDNFVGMRPEVKKLRPYTENDELLALWLEERCNSDHSWC